MNKQSFTFTDEIRQDGVIFTVGYSMDVTPAEYSTGGVVEYPEEIDIDIDYVFAANEAKPKTQVDISIMVSEFVDFDDYLQKKLSEKCRDHMIDALYERSCA